ncbi:molybdopterin cofactor-binding domain-containing protein [Massilia sp. UYP11]|uniref:xanthine dehydrogenase family protein molybdopterin-binding subunit n=1 Tax=Massilia sp. UYP11 TaxID=1756385 RepID=UPI003D1BFB81
MQPPRQRLHPSRPLELAGDEVALNGWVALAPDGAVSVVVPRSEMGQGVHTALPMLVAEELDVGLDAVRVVAPPIDKIYANVTVLRENLPFHPDDAGRTAQGARWLMEKVGRELGIMFTGGSSSVRDAWLPMREAGAVARAMLVRAAADAWQARVEDCRTEDGFVIHLDGRSAGYGALAALAARAGAGLTAKDVRLKPPSAFRLIGQPQPRLDSRAKADGSARFGIDARPAGMVYAALAMAPAIGATVAAFDADAVRRMPGVLAVVDVSSALVGRSGAGAAAAAAAGIAVVASTWWQARQAAQALPVTWQPGAGAAVSSAAVMAGLARALDDKQGHVYHETGTQAVAGAAPHGARTLRAEYRAPFLAHAALEPVNCTAQVMRGKVRLWASTQVPSIALDCAARVAGVAREDVEIEVMLLGGGFGRRLEVDMVAQAVAIAKALGGQPVQLIWTREQDMMHDVYRPAALARFTAQLGADGAILAWDSKSASGAIGHQYVERSLGLPGLGPDKTTAEGAYDHQYPIPNQRVAHVTVDSQVPIGYWRSVGHSHNAFFKESFLDEVAHAGGHDPVALRRTLLARHPRALAVLDAAVGAAGQPPPGRAHGVALHRSFGSTVAQVAEVSVEDGEIRVHRVVCAIDCGLAVNPNIVAQQVESGVVFGLSAALAGEITIEEGTVQQSNFGDYPLLRIAQAPQVETIVMASRAHPEGVGEPAVPPVAPAVAAAVFKLTGQRLRSLPLRLG